MHQAIAISGAHSLLDTRGVHVDAEKARAVHGCSQGLSTAHSSHTAAHDQLASEGSAEMLPSGGCEGFIRALHNALAADVNPGTGGHLAVHGQPQFFETVKLIPIRPPADEVSICNQNARRFAVGADNSNRFA